MVKKEEVHIMANGGGGIFSANIDWDAVANANLGGAAAPAAPPASSLGSVLAAVPAPTTTPTPTSTPTRIPQGITGEYQPEYVEEETYMPNVVVPDISPSIETPAPTTEDFTTIPEDTDAYELIEALLNSYGLGNLISYIPEYVREGLSNNEMMDRFEQTPEYRDRFPALELLREQGMNVIGVDEYIKLENDYRNVMALWGLPEGFYDTSDDFTALIANDVSEAEVASRVQLAALSVAGVDPDLKSQLQILYGIGGEDDGDLIAYFLDPDRAVPLFEQQLQFKAAGFSSAAIQATGQGLNRTAAQRLAERNEITKQQISQALAPRAGLTQDTLSTEGLTTSELAVGTFGLDVESSARIKRLRERRRKTGQAGRSALMTERGAVGLGGAAGQIDS